MTTTKNTKLTKREREIAEQRALLAILQRFFVSFVVHGEFSSFGTIPVVDSECETVERSLLILTINGQPISGRDECILAVNRSPQTMTFTVRDQRNGTVWEMQTELRAGGMRFGVNIMDNGGDGAQVTYVEPGSPCTRNRVLGAVK